MAIHTGSLPLPTQRSAPPCSTPQGRSRQLAACPCNRPSGPRAVAPERGINAPQVSRLQAVSADEVSSPHVHPPCLACLVDAQRLQQGVRKVRLRGTGGPCRRAAAGPVQHRSSTSCCRLMQRKTRLHRRRHCSSYLVIAMPAPLHLEPGSRQLQTLRQVALALPIPPAASSSHLEHRLAHLLGGGLGLEQDVLCELGCAVFVVHRVLRIVRQIQRGQHGSSLAQLLERLLGQAPPSAAVAQEARNVCLGDVAAAAAAAVGLEGQQAGLAAAAKAAAVPAANKVATGLEKQAAWLQGAAGKVVTGPLAAAAAERRCPLAVQRASLCGTTLRAPSQGHALGADSGWAGSPLHIWRPSWREAVCVCWSPQPSPGIQHSMLRQQAPEEPASAASVLRRRKLCFCWLQDALR